MAQTRVVILGGGFGGLSVAKRLLNSGLSDSIAVTIVDPHVASLYTPWLHRLAGGSAHRSTIHDGDIDFVTVRGIRYRQSKVRTVDRVARYVLCEDDSTIPYDILVCAFGGVPNDFGIPGIGAFAFGFGQKHDALLLRDHLARIVHRAKRGIKSRLVILGSGISGTEFAGEFAATIQKMVKRKLLKSNVLSVMLVGNTEAPLSMFSDRLQKIAVRRLQLLNVVCTNSVIVEAVRDGTLEVKTIGDGIPVGESQLIPFDCCVVALGIKMPDVVLTLPFDRNERGRILVEETCAVLGERAVFALGDCAAFAHQKPDPQTAQAAARQARTVAKNIIAIVSRKPCIMYRHKKRWDMIVMLGRGYGIGTIFGVPIWGYTVPVLRRMVDARYFSHITTVKDAILRVTRGIVMYGKGDFSKETQNLDRS